MCSKARGIGGARAHHGCGGQPCRPSTPPPSQPGAGCTHPAGKHLQVQRPVDRVPAELSNAHACTSSGNVRVSASPDGTQQCPRLGAGAGSSSSSHASATSRVEQWWRGGGGSLCTSPAVLQADAGACAWATHSPATAPVMVWVVDRGRPTMLPTEMTKDVAVSMQKPAGGQARGGGGGQDSQQLLPASLTPACGLPRQPAAACQLQPRGRCSQLLPTHRGRG